MKARHFLKCVRYSALSIRLAARARAGTHIWNLDRIACRVYLSQVGISQAPGPLDGSPSKSCSRSAHSGAGGSTIGMGPVFHV
jgi:hypothetical protein